MIGLMKIKIVIIVLLSVFISGCANQSNDVTIDSSENGALENTKDNQNIAEEIKEDESTENISKTTTEVPPIKLLSETETSLTAGAEDKLANAIEVYVSEMTGDITQTVDGYEDSIFNGEITVIRNIQDEDVIYDFMLDGEVLFSTPSLENYNSVDYIQFCDMNGDAQDEILVASYVQNRFGYIVREFYLYELIDSKWSMCLTYGYSDATYEMSNIVGDIYDLDKARIDVNISAQGLEVLLDYGNWNDDDTWNQEAYLLLFR